MKEKIKQNNGITLIALVITIIVLLILAGVSISMLTGQNGILKRAAEAKEETEMSQIKERAELAKLDLDIESWTGRNQGVVKRNALVSAINEEFKGSKISGSVVTTSDNKYDIIVDSNLNITVVKHQATNTGITFNYIVNETESRAVALDVYPVIESLGEVPTYEEYAQQVLASSPSEDDMNRFFIEGENYWAIYYGDVEEGTVFEDISDVWEYWGASDFTYSTAKEYYEAEVASFFPDGIESWLIVSRCIDIVGYVANYGVDVTITCDGETQTINLAHQTYAEFAITVDGEYTISLVDSESNKVEQDIDITGCKEEKYSKIYTKNTETEIEGYKVTIPAGFAVGTSENVSKVSTGLVITDSVDSKGNSTGNEFVWIPVKEDLTVGNTGKKMAALQDGSNTDYRGVLYDWYHDSTGNKTYSWSATWTGSREPDVVSDYDGGEYDTVGITKDGLQSEYNLMIESVKKYGGFYVSRYEMSVENGTGASKIGVKPTSAYDDETKMWYGLYSKAKTYTNAYNSIQASMIWGSQYDAMLNFGLASGNDKNKVNSTEYGNYSGSLIKTGLTQTADVINNVYDLAGNLSEWTLEAEWTRYRIEFRR